MPVTLETFIRRLYACLGDRCFVSGAFVVRVPQTPEFSKFMSQVWHRGYKRRFAVTHNTFQKEKKLHERRCVVGPCIKLGRLVSGSQVEVHLKNFKIECQGVQVPKGIALLYSFGQEGGPQYIFIKLESHKAISFAHAWRALSRYVLHTERAIGKHIEKRRENNWKNDATANRSTRVARAADEDRRLWSWVPGADREARLYDSSFRTGMEAFVPSGAADALLSVSL